MSPKAIKFLIVSPVIHKKSQGAYGGYTPYIREMNLWLKHVDKVRVIAPASNSPLDPLESLYQHPNIEFVRVPFLHFSKIGRIIWSLFVLPYIFFRLFQGMIWASHIHLRCPANMGLLGSIVQVFFPSKPKTVKYANNWDWNSYQPITYRFQQRLLRNTSFTKNASVLVYGDWNETSPNIIPFFTASYTNKDKVVTPLRDISADIENINLIFVGTLTGNKRPLECIQTLENLRAKGVSVTLDLIGDGAQRPDLEKYVAEKSLAKYVRFQGKQNPDNVVEFLKKAHFLVFLSQSEGWPKVVAEAMWWGCLPITTNVSCVGQMVGNMERGVLVDVDPETVADQIMALIDDEEWYHEMCQNAMEWSRQYTLERFEEEIVKLLNK